MDIINSYMEDGQVIEPRPDYVDYYTILYYHRGKFVNLYDVKRKYKEISQVTNPKANYDEDIILEISSLADYIREGQKRISRKECEFVENIITKTLSLDDYCHHNR